MITIDATILAILLVGIFLVMPWKWALILVSIAIPFSFTYALFSGLPPGDMPTWMRLLREGLTILLALNLIATLLLRKEIRLNQYAIPVFLFVLFVIINVFTLSMDHDPLAVMAAIKYWVFWPVLALLISMIVKSKKDVVTWMIWLVRVSVIVAIIGIIEFFTPFGNTYQEGMVLIAGISLPRAISTLGNPNNLGYFLVFAILLQIALIQLHGSQKGRYLLLCILIFCLLATFSRSALLAGTIAVITFFALFKKGWFIPHLLRLKYGLAILVVIVASTWMIQARPMGVTIANPVEQVMFEARLGLWAGLVPLFTRPEVFIVGEGFGSLLGEVSVIGTEIQVIYGTHITTDNNYLSLLAEAGLVGLSLFLVVVFTILGYGLKLRRTLMDDQLKIVNCAIISFLVFGLIANLFSPFMTLFPVALYFWIMVGFLLALRKIDTPQFMAQSKKRTATFDNSGQS